MRSACPLEHRIVAVALDRERDLLEAAAVVRARRQGLRLEPTPLRVAIQHAVDIAGPERRLVAAGSLADLDEDVLRVGGIGLDECELQLLLERGHPLLEPG